MNNKTKPKAARPMRITAHFVISRHRLESGRRRNEMSNQPTAPIEPIMAIVDVLHKQTGEIQDRLNMVLRNDESGKAIRQDTGCELRTSLECLREKHLDILRRIDM